MPNILSGIAVGINLTWVLRLGYLEGLKKLVSIEEECGNLKVASDDKKLKNVNQKKKPDILQARRYPIPSVTNVVQFREILQQEYEIL